jgi:hypothetical protein
MVAVEFGVEIGEYRGLVRVPRQCSNGYCRSGRRPSGVSRGTTNSEPGSRASPSAVADFIDALSERRITRMSRSLTLHHYRDPAAVHRENLNAVR